MPSLSETDRLSVAASRNLGQQAQMDKPTIPYPAATAWLSQIEVRLNSSAREVVAIAYLDGEDALLGVRVSEEGRLGDVHLPLRDILRDVLDNEARALVLAHNHPSGDPQPSVVDQQTTQSLCAMLRPLGVRVADHIIISDGKRISFRALGLL